MDADSGTARFLAQTPPPLPLPVRYVNWLSDLSRGDLGYSPFRRRSVSDLIAAAWENTVILKDDVVGEIQKLKDGEGPELQVHGSGDFI